MVKILKASGKIVQFDTKKLRRSLKKAGASKMHIDEIANEVTKKLYPEITTHSIYQMAFRALREKSRILAAKYKLKKALLNLGDSGYPFEKYFAELMKNAGYKTKNNQIIHGCCINHEVDVVLRNIHNNIFVECKYHMRQGVKSDVTVALYISARFLDIKNNLKNSSQTKFEGWLVTNTRFTKEAMKYAKCAKLKLISWDYPKVGNLKEIIENSGLYPITCISNLTKREVFELTKKNIILCKSLNDNPNILNKLRIQESRKQSILEQCKKLCI